jgi:hypothetical protein
LVVGCLGDRKERNQREAMGPHFRSLRLVSWWIKKSCGICLKFVCDESGSVNEYAVEHLKKTLSSLA